MLTFDFYIYFAVPATGSEGSYQVTNPETQLPTKLSTIDSTRYGGPDLSSR
jgi:hypothetical protein